MYSDSILFIQLYPNFIIFLLSRFHYLDLKFLTATVTVHFIQLLQQVTSSFHSTSPAIQTDTHEMNKLWNAGKKTLKCGKVFLLSCFSYEIASPTIQIHHPKIFLFSFFSYQIASPTIQTPPPTTWTNFGTQENFPILTFFFCEIELIHVLTFFLWK